MCATLRRAISFAATQPNFLNRTAQIAFQRNVLATERTFNPRSYLSHIRQSMTDGEATAAVTATTVEDLEKMTIPDLKSWLKGRSAPVGGNKAALLQRAKDVLEGKLDVSKTVKRKKDGDGESKLAGKGEDEKPKKKKKDDWPPGPLYDIATMRKPLPCSGTPFKVVTWNICGINALRKNHPDALKDLIELESPDVICLQETKLQEKGLESICEALTAELPDYVHHWACSRPPARLGYAGVATLSKVKPLNVTYGIGLEEGDMEGRTITTEFEHCFVVNTYVPNSGDKLKRLDFRIESWDAAMRDHLRELEKKKPVLYAGDLNCAHREIDIHSPKTNLKSAGFTPEERASFEEKFLGDVGLVDAFRDKHPGVVAYTYYSFRNNMREKGRGWRLDYVLVSGSLKDKCVDAFILKDFKGSDHVPAGVTVCLE